MRDPNDFLEPRADGPDGWMLLLFVGIYLIVAFFIYKYSKL